MTRDELLAAVCAASSEPADDIGVTVDEYAKAEGLERTTAYRRLERAMQVGRLLKGYARRPRAGGSTARTPVYRPTENGKKRKRGAA